MRTIDVVIGGPDRSVRRRLREHLERIISDARVVAEAPTTERTIAKARQTGADLVILATGPDDDHADVVNRIRSTPTTRATRVVLMPDVASASMTTAPGILAVLPRSRYSNSALVKALGRRLRSLKV